MKFYCKISKIIIVLRCSTKLFLFKLNVVTKRKITDLIIRQRTKLTERSLLLFFKCYYLVSKGKSD